MQRLFRIHAVVVAMMAAGSILNGGQSPNDPFTLTKEELPVGGKIIIRPDSPKEVLYWISWSTLHLNAKNIQKAAGFYRSEDSGKTWYLRSNDLEFRSVFVHSESGAIYGEILEESLFTDEEGFVREVSRHRLLVSDDGYNWRDLSKDPFYARAFIRIWEDPTQTKEICISLYDELGAVCLVQVRGRNRKDWIRHDREALPDLKHLAPSENSDVPANSEQEGEQAVPPKSDRTGG